MPASAQETAAKALEAARVAAETARVAAETARLTKATADHILLNITERLDRQDEASKEFRESLNKRLDERERKFDAFKSDFDNMDGRCKGHDDTIYGNKAKNMIGVVESVARVDATVVAHDNWIRRFLWTWALVVAMAGVLGWYIVYFYGDAAKRGIFNPSDQEWRWRVNKEIRQSVKPEAMKPQNDPTPGS